MSRLDEPTDYALYMAEQAHHDTYDPIRARNANDRVVAADRSLDLPTSPLPAPPASRTPSAAGRHRGTTTTSAPADARGQGAEPTED